MRLARRLAAAVAAMSLLWSTDAAAQSMYQFEVCVEGANTISARIRIMRCTALLHADDALPGELRPYVLAHRCRAFLDRQDLDRAIADCDGAIGMDPTLAEAFLFRAAAYARKGREEQARADWARAIELDSSLGRKSRK